jgi:hypothetical protein
VAATTLQGLNVLEFGATTRPTDHLELLTFLDWIYWRFFDSADPGNCRAQRRLEAVLAARAGESPQVRSFRDVKERSLIYT